MIIFWSYVAASFVTGGLFIAIQSLLAEHTRGVVRGILLTIPSTMAVGLLFIAFTKSNADLVQAAVILPASLSLAYLFATIFALTSRLHIALNIILSFGLWGVAGALLVRFPPQTFTSSLLISFAVFLGCAILLRLITSGHSFTPSPFSKGQIVLRALFAGSIVALTIILARLNGNIIGGLFAGFPAVYSSTFIMYRYLHGPHIIPAVIYTTLMPGYVGMVIFVAIMYYATVPFGSIGALLLAYAGTFTFDALYYLIHKRVLSFL